MCYVHLADVDLVPLPKEVFDDREKRLSWFLQTKESRWYKRGWTLQELLAPETVHFYNKNWQRLGSKMNFLSALTEITGVETDILDNSVDISRCSVAERMSWAASRTTTRKEDLAYCLIGIMGTPMPLLYGEGAERAFLRLQLEILATTDDQSIFAWTAPDTSPMGWRGLLASSPKEFLGCPKLAIADHADSKNPDCHMTPRGIRITFSIEPVEKKENDSYSSNEYLAVLFCRPSRGNNQNIAIRLMRVYGNVFVRVDCGSPKIWQKRSKDKKELEQLTVIVPQDLQRKWWGRWVCTRIGGLQLILDSSCTVTDVEPMNLSGKNLIWKLSEGRLSTVSCVIRYKTGVEIVFEAAFDRSKTDYRQQLRTRLYAPGQRREWSERSSKDCLGARIFAPELRWDSSMSFPVVSVGVSYKETSELIR